MRTTPPPSDPGPATRPAHNVAGVTPDVAEVPAEPQRIVVLSGDQLDALCALGLQSRVVCRRGAGQAGRRHWVSSRTWAVPCTAYPPSAPAAPPTWNVITAAHPDLILGSVALTPKSYPQLVVIAPTVFTAAPGYVFGKSDLLRVGRRHLNGAAVDALRRLLRSVPSRSGPAMTRPTSRS